MGQVGNRPGEGRRLYQQVADQIRALIRSGQFPALSRLPSERDLAQQLNVSRPSLREALIALEIDGSVEIRMGSGIYVCAPGERLNAATAPLGESPSELMQARLVVEGSIVMLACARMTADALRQIADTATAMEAAIVAGRNPIEHDRDFHMAIAHQSGNVVLARIVANLFDERHSQLSAHMRSKFENQASWTEAVVEHRDIQAAFQAADPLAAQSAMSRHIQQSAARWSETSPAGSDVP